MNNENVIEIEIRRLNGKDEAETCAQMMASSEPWITLRRNYETSLKIITDTSREVYVAIHREEITGFTIVVMQGAFVGYIQSICVASTWRRKGIGSQLMAYAEGRIFNETPNAFICVSSFNKGAQQLYERLGYEVVGKLKDYIIPGHAEILLRKSIGSLSEFKKNRGASSEPKAA